MIPDESTNALTLIMDYVVLISLLKSVAVCSTFQIMISTCCIVPAKVTRTNGLILTSRFRPAGTQIDWIWDVLESRRTQANYVQMQQRQKS